MPYCYLIVVFNLALSCPRYLMVTLTYQTKTKKGGNPLLMLHHACDGKVPKYISVGCPPCLVLFVISLFVEA